MMMETHRNLKKICDREKGNFPKLKQNKQNKVTAVNFLSSNRRNPSPSKLVWRQISL